MTFHVSEAPNMSPLKEEISEELRKVIEDSKTAPITLRLPHVGTGTARENVSAPEVSSSSESPATPESAVISETSESVQAERSSRSEKMMSEAESNFGPGLKMLLGAFDPRTWPRKCRSAVKFLSNPSWAALVQDCECSDLTERLLSMSPSHRDCIDHGEKTLHDIMGASCAMFGLAPLVYLIFCSQATSVGGAAAAAFVAVMLTYVSVFAFLADYWYTSDKPAGRKSGVSDVQKQFVCNYIDRINVPFCTLFMIIIGAFQMYFQGLVVTVPCIFVAFGLAVFTQKWSLQQLKKFLDIAYAPKYDMNNPDAKAIAHLKWGLYWHVIWHILASGLAFSQIYLLLCIPPCH